MIDVPVPPGGDVGSSRLVFASFYTPEYAGEAAGLRESLARVGVSPDEIRVEPRTSLGSWALNCAAKPKFLLGLCVDLRDGDRLVWLDADARLEADPRLFFGVLPDAVDLAAHWRAGTELLSGTLYLRVGDPVRVLLDAWARACDAHRGAWDQRVLQQVVHAVPFLVLANLPPALCAIPDLMPGVRPIVRHRQASRRLKLVVGP